MKRKQRGGREEARSAGSPKKGEGPCERGRLLETRGQETIRRGKHGFWEESVGGLLGVFLGSFLRKRGSFEWRICEERKCGDPNWGEE